MNDTPTRRDFLITGAAGCAAVSLTAACGSARPTATGQGTPTPSADPFRVVEASGTHREIGRAIGAASRASIAHVWQSGPSFAECRDAARGPQQARIQAMEAAVRARFPQLVEELEGMAEGADVAFPDLFAWTCRAELSVAEQPCPPGCSTVGVVREGRLFFAHNEDGGEAYSGRMLVVRVEPPSGVSFTCLMYPGTIAGNGPGLNSRGVAQTTNYIAPCRPTEGGLPRYFIGRAVLEAESLDEAEALATTEGRAFAWHHNLLSLPDARLVSLEVWHDRHHRREVTGVHVHTNHLIHPEMAELPQEAAYLERSSQPRLRALQRRVADAPPEDMAGLVELLSDRSGEGCRVCRRHGDEVPGMTLAAALLESPRLEATLINGPTCEAGQRMVVSY